MSQDRQGLDRLGGAALIMSGLLFLIRGVLEFAAGPPPSNGEAILTWVASEHATLAWVSEVLFAAAVTLVPGIAALYHRLAGTRRSHAVLGCGVFALAIPLLAMSLVVQGRLVYPIYGMQVATSGSAELALTLFYGGMHAVNLLLAVAVAVLSFAMWGGAWGKRIAWLGFATAAGHVVAAYPDHVSPALALGCQGLSAAWLAVVGVTLYRRQ